MKKFIIYVLCVFICAFSGLYIYMYVQSSHYEKTAVPYINEVLPKISTWNPALAKEYMAPEVLSRISPAELESLMLSLSKIGELKSVGEPEFKKKSSGEDMTSEQQPVVTYTLDAQYTSGEAKVTISLLDKGDTFSVYHFNFQTEALSR